MILPAERPPSGISYGSAAAPVTILSQYKRLAADVDGTEAGFSKETCDELVKRKEGGNFRCVHERWCDEW